MLLRFAGPHLAEQSDQLLPVRLRRRRPHDRRRAVVGEAGQAGAVRAGKPVRRAGDPGRRHGVAPGAGRARSRSRQQDLGAAGRRHAAGHGREARQGLDRAGPHHGQCRLVEPRAVGAVRRDAAADRGDEPGRGGGAARRRCRRSKRSTGSAGLQRAPPTARPISGQGHRDRDRLAAASARASTAPPTPGGRSTCRPAIGELKPIGELPTGTGARDFRPKSREIDLRPPLLTAALLLALIDLLIAYALRGLLRRRPARIAAGIVLVGVVGGRRAGAGRRRLCRASHLRAAPRLYAHRQSATVDAESRAGLIGLTATLNRRTAVETAEPLGGRYREVTS